MNTDLGTNMGAQTPMQEKMRAAIEDGAMTRVGAATTHIGHLGECVSMTHDNLNGLENLIDRLNYKVNGEPGNPRAFDDIPAEELHTISACVGHGFTNANRLATLVMSLNELVDQI